MARPPEKIPRPKTPDPRRAKPPNDNRQRQKASPAPDHTSAPNRNPTPAKRPNWERQSPPKKTSEKLVGAIDKTDPLKGPGGGLGGIKDATSGSAGGSTGSKVVKKAATEAVRQGRKALAGTTGGTSEVAIRGGRFLLKYILPLIPVAFIAVLVFAALGSTGATVDPLPYLPNSQSELIPTPYLNAYKSAGERFGIPWTVLAGVGRVTSNHGRSAPSDIDDWGSDLDRNTGSTSGSALGPVAGTVSAQRHAPPAGTLVTISSDHVTQDALGPRIIDYPVSVAGPASTSQLADLLVSLAAQGTGVAVVDVGFLEAATGSSVNASDLEAAAVAGESLTCQIWLVGSQAVDVTPRPNLTILDVQPGAVGTAGRVAEAIDGCAASEPNSSADPPETQASSTSSATSSDLEWDGPIGVYVCSSEGWCGPSPRIGESSDEPQGPLALDPAWLVENSIGGDPNDIANAADILAAALAQIQHDVLVSDTSRTYAGWETNVPTARMLWRAVLLQAPIILPGPDLTAPPACEPDTETTGETTTTIVGETTTTDGVAATDSACPPAAVGDGLPVIPVGGVTGGDLYDSFGAPRSGGRTHEGIDIMADLGTPVLAAVSGTVGDDFHGGVPCKTGGVTAYGNNVRISGDDGNHYFYAHLDSYVVAAGEHVEAGTVIGTVGNTGNACTTPPHLHFSINESRSTVINPYPFLRYGITIGTGQLGIDSYSRMLAFATYYGGIIPGDPEAGTFPITGLAGGGSLVGLTADQSEIVAVIGRYFPSEQVDNATRIAKCESGLNPNASHHNTNGSTDWGLFQLNDGGTLQGLLTKTGEDSTNIALALDPEWASRAAALLWRDVGWAQWVCSWLPTDAAPNRTGIIGEIGNYHSKIPGPGDTSSQSGAYLAP